MPRDVAHQPQRLSTLRSDAFALCETFGFGQMPAQIGHREQRQRPDHIEGAPAIGQQVHSREHQRCQPGAEIIHGTQGAVAPAPRLRRHHFRDHDEAEHFFGVPEYAGEELCPDETLIAGREGSQERKARLGQKRHQQKLTATNNVGTGSQQEREDRGDAEIGCGQPNLVFGNLKFDLNLRYRQAKDILVEAGEQCRGTDQQDGALLLLVHLAMVGIGAQAGRKPPETRRCAQVFHRRLRRRSSAPCNR